MTNSPEPLLSTFNYAIEFNKPEFVLSKGVGAFYIAPVMGTPKSIHTFLDFPPKEIGDYDVVCGNGSSTELLTYIFPEEMKILGKPDDFEIQENHISYKATYDLKGNVLKVSREIHDQTPGNVCSGEIINPQRKTLMKIIENMKTQVVYQHSS